MRWSHNAVVNLVGSAIFVMSLVLVVGPPLPASAADVCKDWGAPSFYCPTTATHDVCGNAPNFYCANDGGNASWDVCTGATPAPRYTFRCNTCTCQCDTANYPCAGCTATSVTPGAACSPPINGKYATGCPESCACGAGTTLCVSTNTCVTNLVCPDGTTFDPCTNSCVTPYILRSPATRQANASILIDGSVNLGNGLVMMAGDFFMPDTAAIRVDKNGAAELNMGNGYGTWASQPFELDVYGQVNTQVNTANPYASRMGVGNIDPGYRLDIANADDTQTILSITDKNAPTTFTGTRLARGLPEKWFSGMSDGSDNFLIYRNGGFATPQVVIDNGTGNVGVGTTGPSATFSVGNAGSSLFTVAGATGDTVIQGDLTVNGNTTLGNAAGDTVNILGRLGDTVLGAGKLLTYGTAAVDPVAGMVEGSMYYNTTDGKFRCYQKHPVTGVHWTDCYADDALQGALANKQVAFSIGGNKLNGSNNFMFDYDTNVLSLNGKMVLGVLGASDSNAYLCRNSLNEIAPCVPLTDAQIADTLTASYLVGPGSLTNAVDLATSEVAGTLSVASGGTGFSSYTVGDMLYASGASTFSKLADVAAGSVLISGGVGAAPVWGKIQLGVHTIGAYDATPDTIADDGSISLSSEVGGILPLANGGTNNSGLSTFPNQVVIINAAGTQLVQSGKTISDLQSASQINSGTLAVARGGTGLSTTPAAGQLLIGNGAGFTLATLTDGSGINITEGPGTITISAQANWPPGASGQTLWHNGTAWTATSDITMDGTGRVDLSGGGSGGCTVYPDGNFSCGGGITASDNDEIRGGAFYMVPIGQPGGTNGRMYYDSGLNKFRCYENSAWKDCISTGITGGGTATYIPVFTGSASLGNSAMYQSGSNIGIGTTVPTRALHVIGGSIFEYSGSTGVIAAVGIGTGSSSAGVKGKGDTYGVIADGGFYGLFSTGGTYSVYGSGGSDAAVYGATSGNYGVRGSGGTAGVYGYSMTYGVHGKTDGATGVRGEGGTYGVYGTGGSGSTYGVYGYSGNIGTYGGGGTYGVYGAGFYGVYGTASPGNGIGVYGKSETGVGVKGETTSTTGFPAVQGIGAGWTRGVEGTSTWGDGVFGTSTSGTASRGISSSGYGGDFQTSTGIGLHASASNSKAARFDGSVGISMEPTTGGFKLGVAGDTYTSGFYYSVGGFGSGGATHLCRYDTGGYVRIGECSSSRDLKGDIRDLDVNEAALRGLRPVSFTWNATSEQSFGLIAEEVAVVWPDLAIWDLITGKPKSVNYDGLSAILLKEWQKLDSSIKFDDAGTIIMSADLAAEANKWGAASSWISCPVEGECSCPNGYFMTSLKDRGALIQCHRL
jgi:hypothetical protein